MFKLTLKCNKLILQLDLRKYAIDYGGEPSGTIVQRHVIEVFTLLGGCRSPTFDNPKTWSQN